MPEATSSARIVLTTTSNLEEANRLGRTLVEERLAACATLIPAVESIYGWKGKVETSSETMLLLKTGAEQLAALKRACMNCTAMKILSSWCSRSNREATRMSHGCSASWVLRK